MADPDRTHRDRLDERWEDRANSAEDRFERRPVRTGLGYFWKACLVIAACLIIGGAVFGVTSWITSWGSEAKRIVGPENSREQTTAVLDDWKSLEATAGNVCDAKNSAPDPNSPTLVEDPAFAYRAQYRRIKADYDRRMNNLFEAYVTKSLPLPGALHGYPKAAPTLKQMTQEVC